MSGKTSRLILLCLFLCLSVCAVAGEKDSTDRKMIPGVYDYGGNILCFLKIDLSVVVSGKVKT